MRLPVGQRTRIGEYEVWLTTPIFSKFSDDSEEAQTLRHYEVLVTHIPTTGPWVGYHFYVNLNKDLLELNLAERNALYAKVFPAKPPKDGESLPLTFEEGDFRDEYQAYQSRKDMGMPMWKLNRRHVLDLFKKLNTMVRA